MRSMIVGIHGTEDGWNGPKPSMSGMHDGVLMIGSNTVACQSAFLRLSQPQPGRVPPAGFFVSANPSSCEAARSRCACQEGTTSCSKVRSEIVNVVARFQRFGI